MRRALANPVYARLFGAQVTSLLGTGLLALGLSLLAFEISGDDSGIVLSAAWTIRIVAYVVLSPIMAALVSRLNPTTVLVIADGIRMLMVLQLTRVTEEWQIYLFMFGLQAAAATFTPVFQATIPQVLPDEEDYTAALSLSRLAYDLEAMLSPVLATLLLSVISFNYLFIIAAFGFLISMELVLQAKPPTLAAQDPTPVRHRITEGARVFARSSELQVLLALNLIVATTFAMVIINTVPLTKGQLGASANSVTALLAAFGTGSMLVALNLPKLLRSISDLKAMAAGAIAAPSSLLLAAWAIALPPGTGQWLALTMIWFSIGAATSLILTPSARLLRRNATPEEQPAVFATQFSLSHACYLITYPAAGWLGTQVGLAETALILAALAAAAGISARLLSRRQPHPNPKP